LGYQIAPEHWTETLFVRHPELYLPFIQSEKLYANQDVEGLHRIFDEFNVGGGSRILDLNCGIGRHAIQLANAGSEIVGYDLSLYYLEEAQSYANSTLDRKSRIRFYQGESNIAGEVLSKNGERDFNAIIIMSNSIGYNTEDYDIQTFKSIFEVADKDCIIIIETENRDWRIRNFQPYINLQFQELEVFEQWKFDLLSSYAEGNARFYRNQKGLDLRLLLDLDLRLRLYSLHELRKLLIASGWNYVKSYGNLKTLESPSFGSEHIVTIGQKNC
jgi:SAM-dependent methyltransferase